MKSAKSYDKSCVKSCNKSCVKSCNKFYTKSYDKSCMMSKKKSMIEIQFNWIFVLVAGIVIFLFIISIVMSQKKQSEERLDTELTRQIAASITGKQQLSNTYNEIDIPQMDIQFFCDIDTNKSEFKIENSQRYTLPTEIIFSSSKISGRRMQLFTLDFSMPYTVTRFMYITTPDTAVIVYGAETDTSIKVQLNQLFSDLPSNITKFRAEDMTTLQGITNQYKKYKIVCINNYCPTPPNSYKYLKITPDASAELYSYGTVSYNAKSRPYISKAGLFGAIFSDNMDYYTCEMNRAYGQLNMKSRIYQKRVDLMITDFPETSICTVIYAGIVMQLDELSKIIFANPTDYDDLENIIATHNAAAQIQVTNKDLEFKSCPQVY